MFVILLGAIALGADADEAPKAPPRILTASVKDDQLVSKVVIPVVVPVTIRQKVNNNGKEEEVTVTTYRTETRTIEQKWELKKSTFSTAGGKKLDLDAVKKRLAKPQPVVLSTTGKAVDESYLKLFDKDALVIVVPMPEPLKVPAPAPPGPPTKEEKKPKDEKKKD
jgi:hypothetical protein